MKFFDLEGPLMQALNKVADLMILNLLAVFCCIPIITIGASFTAMHYVALKMARNEECYIARDFFKSFKLNFRQGTAIWLIELFVILVLAGDFLIMGRVEIPFAKVFKVILTVAAFLALFTFTFVYPVLAKFGNTVIRTIKNAFLIGVLQFPKTIAMLVLSVLPIPVFIMLPQSTPIIFLFGLAVPAWLSAKMYSGNFRKLEEQATAANAPAGDAAEGGEEQRIFKDELDESLLGDTHTP